MCICQKLKMPFTNSLSIIYTTFILLAKLTTNFFPSAINSLVSLNLEFKLPIFVQSVISKIELAILF